jgi:hypothetical protein
MSVRRVVLAEDKEEHAVVPGIAGWMMAKNSSN